MASRSLEALLEPAEVTLHNGMCFIVFLSSRVFPLLSLLIPALMYYQLNLGRATNQVNLFHIEAIIARQTF
jgi:hypothetical protein